MEVVMLILDALFLFCAYHDARRHQIPDVPMALCWLVLALFFPVGCINAVGAFGAIWLLNALLTKEGKSPLGWGDILLFPVFCGAIVFLVKGDVRMQTLMCLSALLIPLVMGYFTKKPAAVAPFMAVALLICSLVF